MNLCRTCGEDFGSVPAFDAHRVGKHEYTFQDGMKMNPPREDGRRCLDIDEIESATNERGELLFARNKRGAWSYRKSLAWGERKTVSRTEAS